MNISQGTITTESSITFNCQPTSLNCSISLWFYVYCAPSWINLSSSSLLADEWWLWMRQNNRGLLDIFLLAYKTIPFGSNDKQFRHSSPLIVSVPRLSFPLFSLFISSKSCIMNVCGIPLIKVRETRALQQLPTTFFVRK